MRGCGAVEWQPRCGAWRQIGWGVLAAGFSLYKRKRVQVCLYQWRGRARIGGGQHFPVLRTWPEAAHQHHEADGWGQGVGSLPQEKGAQVRLSRQSAVGYSVA